jgi:hypothetical protein
MKFAPQTGGNFVHRTFATVKEHAVQQIQKTYKNGGDIAESLNKEEKIDLDKFEPTRTLSKKTGKGEETERAIEQEGLNIKYKVAIEQWSARRNDLEREMMKAYSLIYQNFCTTAMQSRIKEHPEFESKIRDDPIELLKAIKILMQDTVRAKYNYASVTDAFWRILSTKQVEGESVADYASRVKHQRDVLKTHVGKHFLDVFVENTEEYKNETSSTKKQELKDGALERWCAYLTIKNCNQSKYGSLSRTLASQFSMGADQYPRTIITASEILTQYPHDNKSDRSHRRGRSRSRMTRMMTMRFRMLLPRPASRSTR